MLKKAAAILIITCAWIIGALFLVYVASWSLGTILLGSPHLYDVTAATNLLLVVGSFVAFFFLARRIVSEPKETDDL